MNKNRDFKGVWIPKEIYLLEDLNWTEKILLIEIDSLNNEDGCFATNKYFSEFLGVKQNTISLSISKLKKLGLIYQESFDGRRRVLRSRINNSKADFEKNQRQHLKKIKGSILKKSKYNNINNNINNNKESSPVGDPERKKRNRFKKPNLLECSLDIEPEFMTKDQLREYKKSKSGSNGNRGSNRNRDVQKIVDCFEKHFGARLMPIPSGSCPDLNRARALNLHQKYGSDNVCQVIEAYFREKNKFGKSTCLFIVKNILDLFEKYRDVVANLEKNGNLIYLNGKFRVNENKINKEKTYNPNIDGDNESEVNKVAEMIKSGKIKVKY